MGNIDILSWNVNGLRAILRKDFCDWFKIAKPDILSIQETKAHIEQLPRKIKTIPNYNSYFNSAERKGYSGVATFSKIKPNKEINAMGMPEFDNEGRFQRFDFDDFIIMNIYWPNGGMGEDRLKYKLDFYDVFLDYVVDLKNQGKNLVICGDLNTAHKEIDLARPKENEKVSGFMPIERQWIDKFLEAGFIDTFRMFNQKPDNYTWWSYRTRARERNVGWRLDYFFVNEEFKDNVKNSYILSDVMGSDHAPIGLTVEI
jgi:exodeoxyribonuclease-3